MSGDARTAGIPEFTGQARHVNGKINGLVRAAASVSLAGGILAAAAGPAAAASPNEAYGAQATGAVSVSPVAEAAYPGTSPVTLANISAGSDMRKIGIFRQFNSLN